LGECIIMDKITPIEMSDLSRGSRHPGPSGERRALQKR
jgi:hypothetical protein